MVKEKRLTNAKKFSRQCASKIGNKLLDVDSCARELPSGPTFTNSFKAASHKRSGLPESAADTKQYVSQLATWHIYYVGKKSVKLF